MFTFVARDPVTKRSMAINPLQPQTAEEVALFQERQAVADARKAARQGQLPAHRAGASVRADTNVNDTPYAAGQAANNGAGMMPEVVRNS